MTQEELTAWALGNGWQMIAGFPSLTKPSQPGTAIVRLVLKATLASLEIKTPPANGKRWPARLTRRSNPIKTRESQAGWAFPPSRVLPN